MEELHFQYYQILEVILSRELLAVILLGEPPEAILLYHDVQLEMIPMR
jgi:hypothetical protein